MEALLFLAGWCFGFGAAWFIIARSKVGTIRVDNSDPFDGPQLFLELTKPFSSFYRKTYVYLEVKLKDYISHE